MTKLSIIIASYNTKKLLIECINSLIMYYGKELREGLYEIIIVDNASSDGTLEGINELQKKNKNIFLIKNTVNVGFSKANNIGVKKAKGEYILFLNADTLVPERTLNTMLFFMQEHPSAGAATCAVMLPNRKIDDASHRGFPTPWNAFCHFSGLATLFPKSKLFSGYSLSWMNLRVVHEIDALAGAFMLIKRTVGESVAWWDEDFFWYGDDLDFCFRLKEKGWKIYYVPTVSILHYKGASGGIKKISKHITTANKQTKKRATIARFDAMKLFYEKHYKNTYPYIIQKCVFWGIFLKKLFTFI